MGIGGIETGVRDIAKYLNKKKIDNYILCENSNKNFNVNFFSTVDTSSTT